jgi:hypothetical protein
VNATAAKVLYFVSGERHGSGLGFWVCFEANWLRFLCGRGLCYLEIGGAEKKISRGDMVDASCGGWNRRYVVATME